MNWVKSKIRVVTALPQQRLSETCGKLQNYVTILSAQKLFFLKTVCIFYSLHTYVGNHTARFQMGDNKYI